VTTSFDFVSAPDARSLTLLLKRAIAEGCAEAEIEALFLSSSPMLADTAVIRDFAWLLGTSSRDPLLVLGAMVHGELTLFQRWIIADAIGVARETRLLNELAFLFDDSFDEVSLAAALSFAKIGNESLPILETLLRATERKYRVAVLMDALGKIDTDEARQLADSLFSEPKFLDVSSFFRDAKPITKSA
jgi:hypothetical protein